MKLVLILLAVNFIYAQRAGFTCNPDVDCNSANDNSLVPDPENCHNFYLCVNNAPEERPYTCGEDKHFNGNPKKPGCDDGDCDTPICTDYVSPTCKTSCAEIESGSSDRLLTYPGDSQKYYVCLDNGMDMFDGYCGDGKYFDGKGCTNLDKNACGSLCGSPICPTGISVGSKLPDKNNCHNFYICLNGEALQQSCPTNQNFDLISADCVLSEDAECSLYCHDNTGIGPGPDPDPDVCINFDDFTCTEYGRFPLCETMCNQNYILCDIVQGHLIKTLHNCNNEMAFHPTLKFCMTEEKCAEYLP